jgi:hypothetical protein
VTGEAPRLRDGVRDAFWAFLGARLLLFAISLAGTGLMAIPPGQPPLDSGYPAPALTTGWHTLFTATQRQDALWFLRLATDGYPPEGPGAAFFPLYPMAVRAVAWLPGIGPLAAALIVANAAFFGALVVLHALTRLELGEHAARRTVLYAALFPTAFFFLAPYTEPLFLLLSVSAFWFARTNRWVAAAAAGAAAAATRSVGVLLILALAIEALSQWRRQGRSPLPRLAASAAVAAGPLTYFLYWQLRHGDFWAPLDAQRSWARETLPPWTTAWRALTDALEHGSYWLVDVLVVAAVVFGVALAARRIPAAYTVYAAASLVLPLTFPFEARPLMSMPRFVVVIFPAFWGLTLAPSARLRIPENALLGACAAAYGILATLFVNWHYIF